MFGGALPIGRKFGTRKIAIFHLQFSEEAKKLPLQSRKTVLENCSQSQNRGKRARAAASTAPCTAPCLPLHPPSRLPHAGCTEPERCCCRHVRQCDNRMLGFVFQILNLRARAVGHWRLDVCDAHASGGAVPASSSAARIPLRCRHQRHHRAAVVVAAAATCFLISSPRFVRKESEESECLEIQATDHQTDLLLQVLPQPHRFKTTPPKLAMKIQDFACRQ